MQLFLTIAIVLAATAYAVWRISQALTYVDDPCAGCQGCPLKGKISQKEACKDKKWQKNLAETKK